MVYPFPLRAPPEAMIVGARKAEQADGKWRIYICMRSTFDGRPTWSRFGQGNYATREEAVAALECADPDLARPAFVGWAAVQSSAADRRRRARMTPEERAADDEDTARWNREW